jgi:hypothetical protein
VPAQANRPSRGEVGQQQDQHQEGRGGRDLADRLLGVRPADRAHQREQHRPGDGDRRGVGARAAVRRREQRHDEDRARDGERDRVHAGQIRVNR